MQRAIYILVHKGRALEWGTSLMLAMLALTFAMPGNTVAGIRALKVAAEFGLTDAMFAALTGALAGMRIAALIINGSWRPTPQFRKFGASVSAPLFASFGCMMMLPYFSGEQEALGLAPGLLIAASACDILAAYRSAADANAYR